jgi:hypothetical protein
MCVMRALAIITICLMGATAMAGRATPSKMLTGQWGGDRAIMMLTDKGGQISYDCGQGNIDGGIRLDAKGRFRAQGRHEDYMSGPQHADMAPMLKPAAYRGSITGKILTLHVRVTGEPAERTYRLEQDRRTKIIRCL